MEFPRIRSFSTIIIYGLHGINEKTLPRMSHISLFLFFFYRISPCLICHLTLVKWVLYVALYLLYNGVPSLQRCTLYEEYVILRYIILCNVRFCLPNTMQVIIRDYWGCVMSFIYIVLNFPNSFPHNIIYLYNEMYVPCKISELHV